MTINSSALPESEPWAMRARISVLAVADDPSLLESVESGLADEDRVAVRTATTIEALLEHRDDVDCLVLAAATLDSDSAAIADGADAEAGTDGDADGVTLTATTAADVLDRIRQCAPDLPIIVLAATDDCGFGAESESESKAAAASGHDPAVVDAVYAHRWTEYVPCHVRREGDRNFERLGHRLHALVERRRLDALSRRSLASIELAQDPIAIVGPDDTLEFANRWYAMQFGYERAELTGRSWQACFPDEIVAHLESTAIPSVADGWRWTGRCTARRKSGETFSADVRLGGLEDGSLVFVVDELELEGESDAPTE